MKTIWKFPLNLDSEQTINVPKGTNFCHIEFQKEQLCIWGLVDTELEREDVTIRTVGTGQPVPDYENLAYVGTTSHPMFDGGNSLVWHVFTKVNFKPKQFPIKHASA